MKKTILLLAILAFGPATAKGAEPKGTELPAIVVTAGRIEEKATSVTQAVTVIPEEEIRKNQHQDIGGLLRQYGVQVDSYTPNAALSRTTIRGMRTELFGSELQSNVLVLVDGRRSGTGLVALIPLVNVERIEILRGPAAVQYGTSAIGGVVNVITRRGAEESAGMAEVGAGSFETFRSQGELSGKAGGFDYSLGASFLTSDDYKIGEGWRFDNTSVGRKLGYNANLGFNFLEEHRVGITALGVDANDLGDPGGLAYPTPEAYTDRSNYSFDGIYEGGAKNLGLSWQARYFIGRSDYLYSDPSSAYKTQSKTDYQGTQEQLSFEKGFLTLTGGLDWTRYDLRDTSNDGSSYKNTGLFLLAKCSFFEDFIIISGGLRYDYYSLDLSGKDDSLNHATPALGVALNPTGWLTLRANYGESYLVPSAQQFLGYPDASGWGPDYIGNPNLSPEQGKSWDAGFDLRYRTATLAFTYFQTNYEDKISTRPAGADMQYYNIDGKAKFRGIEAQASVDVGHLLDWPFALTPYANLTRMLQYEDEEGNDVKYVSKMDLAYGLGFKHPGWGLDADLRFTHFGRQYIDNFNTWPATEDTLGGRTTADLYVSKIFYRSEKIGSFSLKAELRNLLDKEYALVQDYPMPGRSYWLGLRYDY